MPSAQTYTYSLPSKDRCDHSWNSPSQTCLRRVIVVAAKPGQSGPRMACNASEKPPVLIPFRYNHGINSSMLFVFRKYGGRILEEKGSRSPSGRRSATRG